MNIATIKKLTPFDRLVYFINERENVRLNKESGKKPPYTDDEILSNYRFCNIRRMDDRVSVWLMDNWYKPYYNHRNMVLAVSLARFFNLPSTLAHVGFPVDWNTDVIINKIRELKLRGVNIFNGAYVVRGNNKNEGDDKIDFVVDYYINPLNNPAFMRRLKESTVYMQATYQLLTEQFGFGSFMSGQVVADLRWATEGLWSDRDSWAPVGPGSSRGMRRVLGQTDKLRNVYKQRDFISYLRKLVKDLKMVLPYTITNKLELHDYQNCLCEFDKYERTLSGESKPKQKYPGKSVR